MKFKSFILLALGFLLGACDDTLTDIGTSIRPDADNLKVCFASFDLSSNTFLADSIYVRTSNPLLGQINDALYGTIQAEYATQFYAGKNFNFDVTYKDSLVFSLNNPLDSLINNRLDSAVLTVFYQSYIGDSLTPMGVTAYEVQQSLPKDFYSNVDFTPYVQPLKSLGSAVYTGFHNISDSIKNLSNYTPYVDITLNQEVAERFLNAVRNTPEVFSSEANFLNFFKGVYLTNTFGNGTILRVAGTTIAFYYRTYHDLQPDGSKLVGSNGQDSSYIVSRVKTISSAEDVLQLNKVSNPIVTGGNPLIMNNDSATFVTSPGGYFTEIKIPVKGILAKLNENPDAISRSLNGVSLKIEAYKPSNIFSQSPPTYMLLVEKSKMNDFFESGSMADSKDSYLASFISDSINNNYYYNFQNINNLILNNKDITTDSLSMALVPVNATLNSYGTSITRITNYFVPGGIALKGKKNTQKSTISYTLRLKSDD